MRKLLIWAVLAALITAYGLIQNAPATVAAVATPSPLIVIDPGHGGWDPGAVRGAVYEKSLTLAIALKLGTLLQRKNFRVYYTRTQDSALSSTVLRDLNARAHLANRLGATVFVSIHVNTEPTGTMAGPLVYYNRMSPVSYALAQSISAALVPLTSTARSPRPIRQWILHVATMPAVNVEVGFLSHRLDQSRMQSPAYQEQLSRAIAVGITRYLHR
ncbi:MAG: N-acetylmuramoyl-L-alanine amidase [Sulfobacillus acidophilus]|uniref:N-acetylmuramoyl-L-alanine amidase n=1 Tax=Sulfobacillus acidophilus TaxID=53633 RepID=A0A2T2WIG5_9FIRM|nr:MAG: N-acetylmuramoyl-L-alanine amidase [Sulfobacillus acidophilus]